MLFFTLATLATTAAAQLDLYSTLVSDHELSTLSELLALVPDISNSLVATSNITIFAPTNVAFASVPRDIPEGEAIEWKNDTIAIGALLSNHVFKGYYPAEAVTDTPLFLQSLLDSSFYNYRQPFGNFTGGQYNGVVRDGDHVAVISGELTVSYVTEADIKVQTPSSSTRSTRSSAFGPPLQLFTRRDGLLDFNAADLPYAFGNLDGGDATRQNISDFTPLALYLRALVGRRCGRSSRTISSTMLSSPTQLANVSVPSFQGADLTITVAEDGSAWVNGAKILFPNVLLFNGVAHIFDGVLNPSNAPFNRAGIKPEADASDRVAFPDASAVSKLPFSSISYADNSATYSTPELLKTMLAVDPKTSATATTTSNAKEAGASVTGEPTTVVEAGGSKLVATGAAVAAFVVALLMV
ncbi:hypothetical protein NLU13_8074 [Sarocladium strictum]|uniref:FAS1 domain-containing protein n=1 Tax=Sarocladium strictum TaxID=5046 RepID=A0AA39GB04_SARSR|nr:hypothetical protein NLU13_8074 [Sarocladium strictum]